MTNPYSPTVSKVEPVARVVAGLEQHLAEHGRATWTGHGPNGRRRARQIAQQLGERWAVTATEGDHLGEPGATVVYAWDPERPRSIWTYTGR